MSSTDRVPISDVKNGDSPKCPTQSVLRPEAAGQDPTAILNAKRRYDLLRLRDAFGGMRGSECRLATIYISRSRGEGGRDVVSMCVWAQQRI